MATTFKNMMREVMNMAHRAFQLKGAGHQAEGSHEEAGR